LRHRSHVVLEPRKSPVQARSAASVAAILEATIQYFPNKSALLHAALKRHLDEVTEAVERVCREQRANTLQQMGTALINAFLKAKMSDAKRSVALYSVSSHVDGAKIVQQIGVRANKAIVGMLATACEPLTKDPHLVASILQVAMAGISRRLLESGAPEKPFDTLRQELIFFVCPYLEACSAPPSV
jgi:AcrR family transcriptional regulator